MNLAKLDLQPHNYNENKNIKIYIVLKFLTAYLTPNLHPVQTQELLEWLEKTGYEKKKVWRGFFSVGWLVCLQLAGNLE